MDNTYLTAAAWMSIALAASLVSIRLDESVARSDGHATLCCGPLMFFAATAMAAEEE